MRGLKILQKKPFVSAGTPVYQCLKPRSNCLPSSFHHPQRPQDGGDDADGGQEPDDGGDGETGVEGGADEAGGEGAAEVEEHEVAGEDAAAYFVGDHLEEQVG